MVSAVIHFPSNPTGTGGQHLRTAIALLIATVMHAALLTLPLEFYSGQSSKPEPIAITLRYEAAPATQRPEREQRQESSTPGTPVTGSVKNPQTETAKKTTPNPQKKTRAIKSRPAEIHRPSPEPADISGSNAHTVQPALPTESGAKHRSTVFDPRLSENLAQERNKVRKFKSRDTEYATDSGRFFQKGDSCWEEKNLLPGDIDSNVSQRFNIKCAKTRRSREDIDRLAKKYGIP